MRALDSEATEAAAEIAVSTVLMLSTVHGREAVESAPCAIVSRSEGIAISVVAVVDDGWAQQLRYPSPRIATGSVHCLCAKDSQPAHFQDFC